MGCYCCVKGCGNNKKGSTVSFHALPSNPQLKQQWLRAIGRPDWDPSCHARICSIHFSSDQICTDGKRIRILPNACPNIALPPNSNFEASDIEVCRFCLATDLKLYSLQAGILRRCLDNFVGFNQNSIIGGLPQFVCYECAAYLLKYYNFFKKSMTVQAIILDIFAENGQLTRDLVKKNNGTECLKSTLQHHNTSPATVLFCEYNEDTHTTIFTNGFSSTDNECNIHINLGNIDKDNNSYSSVGNNSLILLENNLYDLKNYTNSKQRNPHSKHEEDHESSIHREIDNNFEVSWPDKNAYDDHTDDEVDERLLEGDESYSIDGDNYKTDDKFPATTIKEKRSVEPFTEDKINIAQESTEKLRYKCDNCDVSFETEGARRVHLLTSNHRKKKPDLRISKIRDPGLNKICKRCGIEFSSREELYEHSKSEHPRKKSAAEGYPKQCDHCEVRVNGRKEHWAHVRQKHPNERASYRAVITAVCDICGKGFQNATKLRLHALRHSRPTLQCARCPRRVFDAQQLAAHGAAHALRRPHRCARCGKAFKHAANLQRHAKVHSDDATYKCNICDKKFKYSSSVALHVRTVHYKIPPPPRKKRSKTKNTDNNDLII